MSENIAVTLKLREEQLKIAKKWIQTDCVKIYKETSVQERTFKIPITREELVIEKEEIIATKPGGDGTQTIRILLNEEQVDFTKHKVALEDVSIYSEQINDIRHIEETLKHEEEIINISGSPKIIDKSNSDIQ